MATPYITWEELLNILRGPGPVAVAEMLSAAVAGGYPRRSALSAANKMFMQRLIDADNHALICNTVHQTKTSR